MTKKRFEICPTHELAPSERRIETLDGFSIGIFNVDGEYYAMKNDCPHQRAPLCEGKLTGTNTSDTPGEYNWERDGQIVTCPWHGWEFDVTSGESVFNPHRVKAKTFEATVESPATSDGGDASNNDVDIAPDGGSCGGCSHQMEGDEPPVETYDVEVEDGVVVVYV